MVEQGRSERDREHENCFSDHLGVMNPSGIALDASFGRVDDAIASGFGAIRGLIVGVS